MSFGRKQGSVLLLTLFLVTLAAFALTVFIEKAFSEIVAEAVFSKRDELRVEAYSVLETTAAVMYAIQTFDRQLYSPAQGWGDPFAMGGVELPPGISASIDFVDEMGKIPLPMANRDQLLRLFQVLGFDEIASGELVDALRSWVDINEAQSSFSAFHREYERAAVPYRPPLRPLNSFYELAAISGFRETFFNENGDPNGLFDRFVSLVSLYRFNTINVNTARPEVLRIWADISESEMAAVERQSGFQMSEKPYFENLEEASAYFGIPLQAGFGVSTQCVRAIITVSDGATDFVLSATLANAGQADALRPPSQINVMPDFEQPVVPEENLQQQRRTRRPTRRQNPQTMVPYPFRFLEISENENIL